MRQFFRQRAKQWLKNRIPAANDQVLDHQKIFIFPSRFGLYFLALCGLLFVLGTNYQNNMMRLMCTFLLSLFLLHLFVSYINFSRLRIKALPSQPAFAGEGGVLPVQFSFQQKTVEGIIHLRWWQTEETENIAVQLDENPTPGVMPYLFHVRGMHTLPRLTLRCDYPLGLYKCWTHLDLDQKVTVYPTPKPCAIRLMEYDSGEKNTSSVSQRGGIDEFHSLRDYQSTDALSNVAWKQAAKSGSWMVKTFEQPVPVSGYLTFESCDSQNTELRLSELTYQVLKLSENKSTFGLAIPGVSIAPDSGENHKVKCLKALATYPVSVPGSKREPVK